MKAIILAAGEGTRLRPLTLETPKAMVEIFGKPLLAHNMDKLLSYVDEFILVVKYKEEKVREYFKENYKGIPISYHTQGEKKGTAGALEGLKLQGDCFVLASDTIFHQSDIDILAQSSSYGVLAKRVTNPEKYGVFQVRENNILIQVVEKPQEYIGNLASLFYFKVNAEIISYAKQVEVSPRGEYELTDALNCFAKNFEIQVLEIQNEYIDITSLDDLEKTKDILELPLGNSLYIENIGENSLSVGIRTEDIENIVSYSQDQEDTALQKNTSDLKRFGTKDTLERWYKDRGRMVFSLLSPEGQLLGIVYYRPSKAPSILEEREKELCQKIQAASTHTSTGGIRLYPIARGKGFATSFLTVTERVYKSLFQNTYICIDIEEENIPSQRAFEKAGYIFIGYGENQKTVQNETHKRMVYIK